MILLSQISSVLVIKHKKVTHYKAAFEIIKRAFWGTASSGGRVLDVKASNLTRVMVWCP